MAAYLSSAEPESHKFTLSNLSRYVTFCLFVAQVRWSSVDRLWPSFLTLELLISLTRTINGPRSKMKARTCQRDSLIKRFRWQLLAKSKILCYVRTISTKDGFNVNGDIVTKLLNWVSELLFVGKVSVTTMQLAIVGSLELTPYPFSCIKGTAICGLKQCVKSWQLLSHLRTTMSTMVVKN